MPCGTPPLWGCGSQGIGLATPDNEAYRTASPDNNWQHPQRGVNIINHKTVVLK